MSSISRFVKDPFPGISHWVGMGLSLIALVALVVAAAGRPWHVVGLSIYGSTLVLLYLASALVHTIHCSPKMENRLERFDFVAIFLLIAGTYTPLCLVTLRGPWGWSMFGAEWGMAAAGITATVLGYRWPRWLRTTLYVLMAWAVALVGLGPLYHAVSSAGIEWLLAGGVIYSIGAVIFATDRPHLVPRYFMAHDLWHCLVLAGSACHFVLIFRFVAMA